MDAHVSVEALEKFKLLLTQFSKNMSVEAQKMQLHLKKTHAQLEQKHFQLKKQIQMCQDPISYERAHQQLIEFERLFAGFCHAAQECIKGFQQQELMATNQQKAVIMIDRKVRVLKDYLMARDTSSGMGQMNGKEVTVQGTNAKPIKEVEIVDHNGRPIGELDEIDLENGVFYEDKTAKGLNVVNPKTGLPAQTPQQFADKQILDKTKKRIKNLGVAKFTRATKNGTPNVPSLDKIKNIRKFIFRLDGDTPELKQAVEKSLEKLRKEFPNYTFEAQFGRKK